MKRSPRAKNGSDEASAMVWRPSIYEKYFEYSPDAIIVTDHNGCIHQVNPQCEQLFGYASTELLGNKIEILIPARFRQQHPAHRYEFNASPRMRSMGAGLDLYALRKDGSELPVNIMLSPVEAKGGRLILAVVRDISERKR